MNPAHATFEQKLRLLLAYGATISLRDPRVNPRFAGHYMVVFWEDEPAGDYDVAIVGNSLVELVDEMFNQASLYSGFEAALSDILAGGVGLLHPDGSAAGPPL